MNKLLHFTVQWRGKKKTSVWGKNSPSAQSDATENTTCTYTVYKHEITYVQNIYGNTVKIGMSLLENGWLSNFWGSQVARQAIKQSALHACQQHSKTTRHAFIKRRIVNVKMAASNLLKSNLLITLHLHSAHRQHNHHQTKNICFIGTKYDSAFRQCYLSYHCSMNENLKWKILITVLFGI